MDLDLISLDRKIFLDPFWEEFNARKKNASSNEIAEYLSFKLIIITQKLGELNAASPKYTEHLPYIHELENLKSQLNVELQKEFQTVDSENLNIEPIRLDYGISNQRVLEILYKSLYPVFVECEKKQFESHFLNSTSNLIKWKKQESTFVFLFSKLKIDSANKWELLSKHFLNRNNTLFKPRQLSNVLSKNEGVKVSNSIEMEEALSKINSL